ncbi:MAG: CPXCG motif-containing cysteine-rich protein [Candidatus Competibacteraceae bacterium]|nr:CPXCG motif-containing cysteine-rich protein [Candidatus Competibacteraceae bacterium]
MLEWITVNCPYCGEPFETSVDCSAGAQEYIEDCPVCCHPIVFSIAVDWDGALAAVETRQDN